MRLGIIPLLFLLNPSTGSTNSFFVGYEFGQMVFNDFKNVAGEIGYSFENRHAVRIALFNVALSERHLSSDEASAVEGDNVKGLWHGVDLYYDYPVTNNIFISPSIGHHDNEYTHTVLGTTVRQSSPSAGVTVSYLGNDILGIEQLYWRFSLAFRYNFKEEDDANLGDSIVRGDTSGFTPAIYIGYGF